MITDLGEVVSTPDEIKLQFKIRAQTIRLETLGRLLDATEIHF